MTKFFYYAKLNDNKVCTMIEARTDKLTNVDGYIHLPEYNETVLHRKWGNNQWSSETFAPSVDTILQEKVASFETLVTQLRDENTLLNNEINQLKAENATLNSAVDQLILDSLSI